MTALIGTSGAGKSTLLKIIGLVERADSGEYLLDNVNVTNCSDKSATKLLIRSNIITNI